MDEKKSFSERKTDLIQGGIDLIRKIKPTRKTSGFLDKGVMTPEEVKIFPFFFKIDHFLQNKKEKRTLY